MLSIHGVKEQGVFTKHREAAYETYMKALHLDAHIPPRRMKLDQLQIVATFVIRQYKRKNGDGNEVREVTRSVEEKLERSALL